MCCCSAYAKSLRCLKNLQKPRKNCGFCIVRSFSHCKLACAKKLRKMMVLDLQNHARDAPNLPEIEPGAPQDGQKPTKSDNKRSKTGKMRPRRAQERKKAPTWPPRPSQILRNSDPLARGGPPLGISYRYFLLYILHIVLTRLAPPSGAADFGPNPALRIKDP